VKHLRRLWEEKAVAPVKNRQGGTWKGIRKALSEGNRATGDREWTPTVLKTMEGHLWKTPGEAVEHASVQRQPYERVGKDGAKDRGWLSQTIKRLRELLLKAAKSPERKLGRLDVAEAKCNELRLQQGPRASDGTDDGIGVAKRTSIRQRKTWSGTTEGLERNIGRKRPGTP